jgi:hypothetical protein
VISQPSRTECEMGHETIRQFYTAAAESGMRCRVRIDGPSARPIRDRLLPGERPDQGYAGGQGGRGYWGV